MLPPTFRVGRPPPKMSLTKTTIDPDELNLQPVLAPILRTEQGLPHIALEMCAWVCTVSQDSLEPAVHWRPRLGMEPEERTSNIIAFQRPQGPTKRS